MKRPRPRGKEPVLFSRRLNSMVLSAASTMSGSMPSAAAAPAFPEISASTRGASATGDPLHAHTEGRLAKSPLRPPMTSSPSPESTSALRSGDACVPMIA